MQEALLQRLGAGCSVHVNTPTAEQVSPSTPITTQVLQVPSGAGFAPGKAVKGATDTDPGP